MFLTQWARCHWADSHSSRVTSRQPGKRVQSGSTSSRRRYGVAAGRSARSAVSTLTSARSSRGHARTSHRCAAARAGCVGGDVLCQSTRDHPAGPMQHRKISCMTHRLEDRTCDSAARDQRSDRPAPRARRRPACCRRRPTRLDTRRELWPDEVRIRVERLNLDAATLPAARSASTAATATRSAPRCSRSSRTRGKMQNPVTGSGGMLIGTVDEVGPELPARPEAGRPGRHAGLADADPAGDHRRPGAAGTAAASRCPCDGHAILFGRSIAAVLPDDLRPSWPSR